MTSATPQPVTHILCPVDGSDEGCRAAAMAACLSSALGAKLSYIAVAKPAKLTPEIEAYLALEGLDGLEMPHPMPQAEACMRTAVGIASQCGASDVTQRIDIGKPFDAISYRVQDDGIDLVVMGFRRRLALKTLGRLHLADQIAEKLDIAVLTVP